MDGERGIGPFEPAIFVRIEWLDGQPVATFISDDGEMFGLDPEGVALRITLLERDGRDTSEERRARAAMT